MDNAQADLRQEFVSDAAVIYVENCAVCHGAAGEGIGPMPALDNDGLRAADYDFLYKTIARGRYDTTMSGWHDEEGGIFNEYQIDELVALIRYADWPQVGELAAAQGLIPPTLPVPEVDEAFLAEVAALSPEGSHLGRRDAIYANNCTICHGINGEGSDLGRAPEYAEIRATEPPNWPHHQRRRARHDDGRLGQRSGPAEIEALVSFLQNWDRHRRSRAWS